MRRFFIFVLLVAVCVFGLYRWTESRSPAGYPEAFTPASGPKLDDNDVHVLAAMDTEYTTLVQAVVPSVVSITATRHVDSSQAGDPFSRFFGRRFRRSQPAEETTLGSGVVVSNEGHILTNQHVVADIDDVSVRFSDGREVPARVIGGDATTDIAVLKVSGVNVTPLAFADSDKVQVGQRVVAVGNPFGLDESVTQGIICAKGRSEEDSVTDFFQTDAVINPGNSGGPLVDIHGEIVGINASIVADSGGWEGVGFAIPANSAKRALDAIIRTGRVSHGYLGVLRATVVPSRSTELHEPDGAYIDGVVSGSPADKAGLRKGDVITSISDHAVHSFNEFRSQISSLDAGSTVALGIERGNKTLSLNTQVTELPQSAPPGPPDGANGILAGVHVVEIPADDAEDLPRFAHGVMVSGVDDNFPATGNLQQSDIIEGLNHLPIYDVAGYRTAASQLSGEEVYVSFIRGGHRSFAVITEQ